MFENLYHSVTMLAVISEKSINIHSSELFSQDFLANKHFLLHSDGSLRCQNADVPTNYRLVAKQRNLSSLSSKFDCTVGWRLLCGLGQGATGLCCCPEAGRSWWPLEGR